MMRIFYLIFLPLFVLSSILIIAFYFIYINNYEKNFIAGTANKSQLFHYIISNKIKDSSNIEISFCDSIIHNIYNDNIKIYLFNTKYEQIYPRIDNKNYINLANFNFFKDEKLSFFYNFDDEKINIVNPIYLNQVIWGYLKYSENIREFYLEKRYALYEFIVIFLIVTIINISISKLISHQFRKDFQELSFALNKVGDYVFNYKIRSSFIKEVKIIERSYYKMVRELDRYFRSSQLNRQKVEGIINSIKEGFLVIDLNGKILLCNQGFKDIVKRDEINNKYYWEILQNADFDTFFKKVQKKHKNITSEIEIDNKYYVCSGNFLEEENEIAIILNDITQLKILENIKKDFVTNVSHELRTPLTAINGFVETLQEEAPEQMQRYLSIIKRHTDRLINIVQDLLTLSKLEDKEIKIVKEPANIRNILENVKIIFEQRLKEKGLKLIINIEEGFPEINVDVFKIEQMFINLIDNAIKYTDDGEISINISKKDNYAKIIVSDTGIGIPKDKLDRIFERFYVVDKSRSRKVGGTGLGLAIVKHIVLLHNGEIKVENAQPKGTKFTILLPIK